MVDFARFKTIADFKVIEIVDEREPYLALLGIEWDFDNNDVIDPKKEMMTFEVDGDRVVQPLDPYKGPQYIEIMDDAFQDTMLDYIYNPTTRKREYYVNPTMDGSVRYWSIHSFDRI